MKNLFLLSLICFGFIGCELRPSTDVNAPSKEQLESYQQTLDKEREPEYECNKP